MCVLLHVYRCHKLECFLHILQGGVLQNVQTANLYAVWRHIQKLHSGYALLVVAMECFAFNDELKHYINNEHWNVSFLCFLSLLTCRICRSRKKGGTHKNH